MFNLKKLPSFIGQLNALKELDLSWCSNLETLPSSIEKTTFVYWPIECTTKTWFKRVFQLERITFIYGQLNALRKFCLDCEWVSQLKIIPFIYWPIECIPDPYLWNFFSNLKTSWNKYIHLLANWKHSKCFIYQNVPTWDNYFPILANWVQSKSFICQGGPIFKNYFHLLVIECIWKSWFVWMLQLAGITYMYIG
jgi:hypothetical protein